MKIDILKIITLIFTISLVIFYYQFVNKVTLGNNHLNSRDIQELEEGDASSNYNDDYDSVEYSKKVVLKFLEQASSNRNYSQFLIDDFSKVYEKYSDIEFNNFKNNKLVLKDKDNIYNIRYRTDYKSDNYGEVMVFDVVVLREGFSYPYGYNVLIDENNVDKEKMFSVHVIEYAPYNVKVYKILE